MVNKYVSRYIRSHYFRRNTKNRKLSNTANNLYWKTVKLSIYSDEDPIIEGVYVRKIISTQKNTIIHNLLASNGNKWIRYDGMKQKFRAFMKNLLIDQNTALIYNRKKIHRKFVVAYLTKRFYK